MVLFYLWWANCNRNRCLFYSFKEKKDIFDLDPRPFFVHFHGLAGKAIEISAILLNGENVD